jgi:tetratricopeptide (TPR) repeat protein
VGEPDSAVSLLKGAASRHPEDGRLNQTLGAAYETIHRYDAAHCAYVRWLAADTTRAWVWMGLARTAFLSGDTRAALGYWTHLNAILPGYLTGTIVDAGFALRNPFDYPDQLRDQQLYDSASKTGPRGIGPIPLAAVLAEVPACRSRWGKE